MSISKTKGKKADSRGIAAALPLIIIVLIALAVRFVYYIEVRDSPLFQVPQIDAESYDTLASQIAEGELLAPRGAPYWQPPFYPMFLALIYAVFGYSLTIVRFIQFGMGAASCGLVYLIASRYFNRSVAFVAGLICAVNASLIYYEGELLTPALTIFLNLLAIWTILGFHERSSLWRPAVTGLLLGLSGIARPDALLFVPAVIIWLYVSCRKQPARKIAVVLLAVAAALPVGAVAARNYLESGQPVIISWNGGINFYIGNGVNSNILQRLRPGSGWEWLDSMPLREGITKESARSNYFYKKTLSEYRANPLAYSKVLARKAVLFWNGSEIRRNHDDYHNRRHSGLYRALLWKKGSFGFPFGILGPLTLLGLWICLPKKREMTLLYGFLATQFVAVVAFFVCSRYRAPLIPIFSIFAAAALAEIAGNFRKRDIMAGASLLLLLVPLVAITLVNSSLTNENPKIVRAETLYYVGAANIALGNEELAVKDLEQSVRLNPKEGSVRGMLGGLYYKQGRLDDAVRELEAAVSLAPYLTDARTLLEALK